MLKHKLVRGILMHNQITDLTDLNSIRVISGTTNGRIYFYDVEGDYVYATWSTTTPVIVDSNTTGITVAPASATLYNTGTTVQLTITNQNGDDVTFECSYSGYNTSLLTASTSGLLTATSTAGLTGATTVTVTHNDGPTGATVITVRRATTALTVTPTSSTLYNSGTTLQLAVVNQSGRNVLSECTFSGYNTSLLTASTSGLLTATSTAGLTGVTTVTITHADGATGSTAITVARATSTITVTGTTSLNAYLVSAGTMTVYSQSNRNVTTECTYVSSNTGVTTVGASTGRLTITGTGTTTITATHADSATGSTVVTVTGEVVTSVTVSPTGGTHITGTTFVITISDQKSNDITQYCVVSSGSAVYVANFNAGTGTVTLTDVAGSPTLAFGNTTWNKYGDYAAVIVG